MKRAASRVWARLVPALYGVGVVMFVVGVGYGAWWVLDRGATPATPPAVGSVSSDPNGSVATFEVNGRTVWCAVIDPPGEAVAMSCDWTREATR